MPTYEYQCSSCKRRFEEFQRITDPPLTRCPKCGKRTIKRLIGGGMGIIFKGSGFYSTDHKKSASTSGPISGSNGSSKPEGKTESQPAGKSESSGSKT